MIRIWRFKIGWSRKWFSWDYEPDQISQWPMSIRLVIVRFSLSFLGTAYRA